jgi:hypothetical protein
MADTHCDDGDVPEIGDPKASASSSGGSLVRPQTMADADENDGYEANTVGATIPPPSGVDNITTTAAGLRSIVTFASMRTNLAVEATTTTSSTRSEASSTPVDVRRSQILTEETDTTPFSTLSSLAPETLPLRSPSMTSSPGVEQASSEVR